jgi:hypothetical protein
MDNVFTKAAGASSNRKFANQSKVARFSPSYGVRRGFIKDPNWPPAQFPEEGTASSRRLRRMPATFQVGVGETAPITVTGNISSGGVMFTMSNVLTRSQVDVRFGTASARAEVIASESKDAQFVYRAQFLDLYAGAAVWMALVKAQN